MVDEPNQDRISVMLAGVSAGTDSVRGDFEASKFHHIAAEDEFLRVEYDSMAAANVKPLDRLMEALFQGVCPEKGVVNALGFVGDFSNDFIVSPCVSIARCNVALGGGFVAVSAPWCDEGGEVAVFCTNGDAVVAVPCIENGLLLSVWDRPRLVERRGCVVCLPFDVGVEGLKVNCLPWLPIFLQITTRGHNVTGSPIGTGSRTPRRTSWLRPAFTSCCQ
ncbi:hypothetical protein RRG08_042007 [Elysia crispata]|uniref:Uncharacterized protein n=1 Tax=Elysia crispata TaxID=231223 RepID=A0AAE0ZA54_9GAST|nr:hypothetical protein RRG08_042007 [Elysia crispata]